MAENQDSRTQGIEFGDLREELESIDYPADLETVLSSYGDHEIDLEDGSKTLEEVLSPLQGETYESPEGVLDSVRNLVGDQAVGREGYSDRGSGGTEQDEGNDESF